MKIAGFFNGHDCSYCILENGVPIIHAELERYIREKEPAGDSYGMLLDITKDIDDIDYFVVSGAAGSRNIFSHKEEWRDSYPERVGRKAPNLDKHFNNPKVESLLAYPDEEILQVGHHKSHAANTFFSSNLPEALIITIDGGGREESSSTWKGGRATSLTVWRGYGNKIYPITKGFDCDDCDDSILCSNISVGQVWSQYTSKIFELSIGHPYGHSAGTVMAMAAFGDSSRYINEMNREGIYKFCSRMETVLQDLSDEDKDKIKFDIAASLQKWTEEKITSIVSEALKHYDTQNLCLAGGVSLNSVCLGKLLDRFNFKNIYVTPTPHDGGLTLGATQYLYHHILDNQRIKWKDNFSPYLGQTYSNELIYNTLNTDDKILKKLSKLNYKLKYEDVTDDDILDLLENQEIISVFRGGSESGRRALGNRSILADPRSPDMKDMINEKVKHRQWFRPFAPSILREDVKDWFEKDVDSPYMNFVIKFKEEVRDKVPAVVHHDGSARLQTVTENDNKWYYNFIKKFKERTGVPILLNTSFNDREPIVENPYDAVNCFLNTNIDAVYFVDAGLLVRKEKV